MCCLANNITTLVTQGGKAAYSAQMTTPPTSWFKVSQAQPFDLDESSREGLVAVDRMDSKYELPKVFCFAQSL